MKNSIFNTMKRLDWLMFSPLMLSALLIDTSAQDMHKEVFVVRPYEPTLSEASKISLMPSLQDVEATIPSFNYKITPRPAEIIFEVAPIKPAKMVSSGLPRIYNTFLRVGFGNYATPLAEFNISNLHSKDYALGAYLYHKSSHSNLRLENDDKVPGGYAVNHVNLYGKKFFKNASLTGNITLDHEGFNYYGYNTRLFDMDSLPSMDRSEIRQYALLFGAATGIRSTYTDSLHLNYELNLRYNYFTDKTSHTENAVYLKSSFSKLIESFMGGIDINVSYFKPSTNIDSIGNTVLGFSPYISKRSTDWKFVLGFEGVADNADVSRFYLYPRGLLEFTVVEKIIIPFIGIDGRLELNNYAKIMDENHFITPGLKIKNTSHKLIVYGGVKGSISKEVRFRADISFSSIANMYFFVNDTTTELQNTFAVEYDDVDMIKYRGELAVDPSDQLKITAGFNYYNFNMLQLAKPWHKPSFDLTLSAVYNLKEKIIFNADLLVLGTRYAKTSAVTADYMKLDPVIDINLGIEYLFSKVFTLFFNMYNIAGNSYLLWNQYPSQRFNFIAGFTYKL
jgi:hypothetical protein